MTLHLPSTDPMPLTHPFLDPNTFSTHLYHRSHSQTLGGAPSLGIPSFAWCETIGIDPIGVSLPLQV